MSTTCENCNRLFTKSLPDDPDICPYCRLLQLNPMNPADWDRETGMPMSVEQLQELFPELEILGFHRSGGMGHVYAVRQKSLDRPAALKILRSEIAGDIESRNRFQREARSMAELDHPNIVSIYDFGDRDGKCLYLLMEFVEGRNLGEILKEDTPDLNEALELITQISRAVQFAHSKNIIHRDIKPGNVLVTPEFQAKITDFGLAKSIGPVTDPALTRSEVGMGTPCYMAPEQITNASEADSKSDIFALGVLFYQILTGKIPKGKAGVIKNKYPQCRLLEEYIQRALSDEPTQRPESAREFETVAGKCRRKSTKKKSSLVPILIFLPILISAVIYFFWLNADEDASVAVDLPPGNVRYWSPQNPKGIPFFVGQGPFSQLRVSRVYPRSIIAHHVDGSVLSAFHPFSKDGVMMMTSSYRLNTDFTLNTIDANKKLREFLSDVSNEKIIDLSGGTKMDFFLTSARKIHVAATKDIREQHEEMLRKIETYDNVKSISTWAENGVLLLESGEIICWNTRHGGFLSNAPKRNGWKSIACGKFHFTGIDDEGKIFTWRADPSDNLPGLQKALQIPEKAHRKPALRVKTDATFSAVQFIDGTWIGWGDDRELGLIEKIAEIGPARDIGFRTWPSDFIELYWIVN